MDNDPQIDTETNSRTTFIETALKQNSIGEKLMNGQKINIVVPDYSDADLLISENSPLKKAYAEAVKRNGTSETKLRSGTLNKFLVLDFRNVGTEELKITIDQFIEQIPEYEDIDGGINSASIQDSQPGSYIVVVAPEKVRGQFVSENYPNARRITKLAKHSQVLFVTTNPKIAADTAVDEAIREVYYSSMNSH